MSKKIKRFYFIHLEMEVNIIQKDFKWLTVFREGKVLIARGCIFVNGNKYCVDIKYSTFFPYRMDRIHITNQDIKYNDDIHLYDDLSLCLYHPTIDNPFGKIIPLHRMIPWITEWCHFYEEYKKYGVWLAPEIKHRVI